MGPAGKSFMLNWHSRGRDGAGAIRVGVHFFPAAAAISRRIGALRLLPPLLFPFCLWWCLLAGAGRLDARIIGYVLQWWMLHMYLHVLLFLRSTGFGLDAFWLIGCGAVDRFVSCGSIAIY